MTRQTNKTPSNQAEPEKEVHITFNLDEFAALGKLGFRERWAYFVFKRHANFKTGVFGEHLNQKYSFQAIADLIKPPPGVQGRGEGRIDDTQARDFVLRMEAVGLVSGIGRRANGGLRFDLPMSPRDRKKANPTGQSAGEKTGQSAGKKENIFPEAAMLEIAANPQPVLDCEQSADDQSVLINKKTKTINIEEADPSNDGTASDRAFGATPCRAEGAAPVRENPRAVAASAAPLTAQQIYNTLADSWVITETNTPQAWQLYEAWAGAILLDDLHAAMISVEEREGGRETTPSDLMPYLLPVIADCRPCQPSA